jgi:hypothetical protein
MPNEINSTGLVTKTLPELIAEFTAAYQAIYGTDINLDSDSPDGQQMMIFLQAVKDCLDLLTQINACFDPDQAFGSTLDQRVGINGIQRQAGTYTVQNILITVDRACTLPGINTQPNDPYVVSDDVGNNWELVTEKVFAAAGSESLIFRAAEPGAVVSSPNTITTPVSVVLGVTTINNPTTYTILGLAEETDAALKIRRQKAVSQAASSYKPSLEAALANISGVTGALVFENNTGTTDSNGVPGHSIWVIVEGSGADADIANAIYQKRNSGCGMLGDVSYVITEVDGNLFTVRWDVVEAEDLYIKFTAESIDGVNPPDIAAIKTGLLTGFIPSVNQEININSLATAIQAIDPNCLVTDAGFCLTETGSYTETLEPSARNKKLTLAAARIFVTPIILSPVTVSVVHGLTQQFTPLGGRFPFTYSMTSAPSGGSVDAAGLYTAGSTYPATDIVKVVDADAAEASATVSVT